MSKWEKFLRDFKESFNFKKDIRDFLIIVGIVILVIVGLAYAVKWGWII